MHNLYSNICMEGITAVRSIARAPRAAGDPSSWALGGGKTPVHGEQPPGKREPKAE